MMNLIKVVGACFITAVFLFMIWWIWNFSIEAAFISGYNVGKAQCSEPGVYVPQTGMEIYETSLGSRYTGSGRSADRSY